MAIRVSQVVWETTVLESPAIRVSQVVWETAVLPGGVPASAVIPRAKITGGGSGGGCKPCPTVCSPYSNLMMGARLLRAPVEDICLPDELIAAIGWHLLVE